MCTALVSALTKVPVRSNVAMTGEITLRGEVLPIGGLKEKLLAAHRGGIDTVIIPKENERDLTEIPRNIKQNLDIRPVRWIDEVLDVALSTHPEIGTSEPESEGQAPPKESESAPKVEKKKDTGAMTHH
jgi:ATP-dependent Lon protease